MKRPPQAELKPRMQRFEAFVHGVYGIFDHDNPSLLKIGIREDLIAGLNEVPEEEIDLFLRWWTQRHEYRLINSADRQRVDLHGNPAPSFNEYQKRNRAA